MSKGCRGPGSGSSSERGLSGGPPHSGGGSSSSGSSSSGGSCTQMRSRILRREEARDSHAPVPLPVPGVPAPSPTSAGWIVGSAAIWLPCEFQVIADARRTERRRPGRRPLLKGRPQLTRSSCCTNLREPLAGAKRAPCRLGAADAGVPRSAHTSASQRVSAA